MRVLLLSGPSLNMLGVREPEIYGTMTYLQLFQEMREYAVARGVELIHYQSNHEGALIDRIQQSWREGDTAILFNPGAYTHTSIALLDAVKSVPMPVVEIHLSDPMQREEFRHVSYVSMGCIGTFNGKGIDSYKEALDYLLTYLAEHP